MSKITLFDPVSLGKLTLANRIIMAPLTRARAGKERIPNEMMAEYYAQRASAGLIISEATSVHPMGVGYANTPGIWSKEQIAGWKKITKAVHEKKGKILLQLWHVGRISDPFFLNGETPLAPSAIAPQGNVSLLRPEKNYVIPRELTKTEIKNIVLAFQMAAQNAKEADFDGVEIHGANGYLLDQFLQDSTNKRTDEYGGGIENRARFPLEVTDAVLKIWDPGNVGYHIAPRADAHSMGDSNLEKTFTYLMEELKKRNLAFVFSREHQGEGYLGEKLSKAFGGAYIVNEKLDQKVAEEIINRGYAKAVSFGMNFISNPDLVLKFKEQKKLTPVNLETLYSGSKEGYTDYV